MSWLLLLLHLRLAFGKSTAVCLSLRLVFLRLFAHLVHFYVHITSRIRVWLAGTKLWAQRGLLLALIYTERL